MCETQTARRISSGLASFSFSSTLGERDRERGREKVCGSNGFVVLSCGYEPMCFAKTRVGEWIFMDLGLGMKARGLSGLIKIKFDRDMVSRKQSLAMCLVCATRQLLEIYGIDFEYCISRSDTFE